MEPLLTIADRAARSAGDVIAKAIQRLDTIEITRKGHNDFVTNVDKQCEQIIINTIHDAYPDHAILGEESGEVGAHETQWVIDPLDGTTNFIHGFPHICISIAVLKNKRLECGLIYDPIRQETFSAYRGKGTYLNHRHRLRVSTQQSIQGALLSTAFPFAKDRSLLDYLKPLEKLFYDAAGIRRTGSAALDLAYVAAGRLDGVWMPRLKSWDMAAGAILIKEAGGIVSDLRGGEDYLQRGEIVAGNPKMFKTLLKEVHIKT